MPTLFHFIHSYRNPDTRNEQIVERSGKVTLGSIQWGGRGGGDVCSADTLTSYLRKKINLGRWREVWSPLRTETWNEKHFPSLKEKPRRTLRASVQRLSFKSFLCHIWPAVSGMLFNSLDLWVLIWDEEQDVCMVWGGREGKKKIEWGH